MANLKTMKCSMRWHKQLIVDYLELRDLELGCLLEYGGKSMKLSDILTMALGRVDETLEDIDDIALSIMKNAVNQAYIAIRSTVDRRVTAHILDQAITPVELPADCIEVVMITHSVGRVFTN